MNELGNISINPLEWDFVKKKLADKAEIEFWERYKGKIQFLIVLFLILFLWCQAK